MIPNREKWPSQALMLTNRIKKNQRKFKSWRKQHQITCYRLYNLDIPEIPLLVDWYDGRLHVGVKMKGQSDPEVENEWIGFLVTQLANNLNVSSQDLFIKYRRQEKGGTQYTPMASDGKVFEVQEGGHKFVVNLSDYLDTGLFLDHRLTRKMVQKEAAGKRFLNLFAYTGSFTVYAAAGGAISTTTLDLSNTYLEAARINMKRNEFIGPSHRYIKKDIVQLLKQGAMREIFDLVVVDAPTISKSKSMKQSLVIQKDYMWMLNTVLQSVAKNGVIFFSCNYSQFKFDFQQIDAATVTDITAQTIPMDFSNRIPHRCYRIVK